MHERFEDRFRRNVEALRLGRAPRVLVALSGGADSVALLHLLRFIAPPARLAAAHLDHAMRPGSEDDAAWVRGLCRSWGVPLLSGRAAVPPRTEEEARSARYAFLRSAAAEQGATWIATAHHADDQAETVLFRALRGTGIEGLRGIPARTAAGLVRPLLPFWRREIREYAARAGLRWREDPTNLAVDAARNRLRQRILPEIERSVAPGARRSLVRLAALAREADVAWRVLLPALEAEAVRHEGEACLLARDRLRAYDPAVGARILRDVLRRFGPVPGRAGTRAALQFITDATSGRELWLPGGVRISTEFADARVERPQVPAPDRPLEIPLAGAEPEGEGTLLLGGRASRIRWWTAPAAGGSELALRLDLIRPPLLLRARRAGDRIRLAGGTKTLKKLFVERRVPRPRRGELAVVEDADGRILAVAGLVVDPELSPRAGDRALHLSVHDD